PRPRPAPGWCTPCRGTPWPWTAGCGSPPGRCAGCGTCVEEDVSRKTRNVNAPDLPGRFAVLDLHADPRSNLADACSPLPGSSAGAAAAGREPSGAAPP